MTRDDKGRKFYWTVYRGHYVPEWDDLPDHRKERYRIAAETFERWLVANGIVEIVPSGTAQAA